jgi:hypothetical protein
MADVATSSAPATETKKPVVVKPERPDDEEYKKGLAGKEKEHKVKQDALVCWITINL